MKKFFVKLTALLTSVLICIVSIGTFKATALTEAGTYIVYSMKLNRQGQYTISHDVSTNADNTPSVAAIIGNDNRVPDPDNLSVVRLSNGGTGFIVGPHTIATAAHCVVTDKTFNKDLTASIVGANGNVIETVAAKYLHVPYQFYYGSNYPNPDYHLNYDFAMIEVEEDLSEYGCFDLGTILDNYTTDAIDTTVGVSGFPQRTGETWGTRYIGYGQVTSQTEYRLNYNADANNGDSGGPVYTTITTAYGTTYKVAIGIHTTSYRNTETGEGIGSGGVKITSRLLQFYLYNSHKTYDSID